MMRTMAILIQILCLKRAESSKEPYSLIEEHTQIKITSYSFLQEIVLYDNTILFDSFIITAYIPETEKPSIDQLYGYKVLTNCEFACWTMKKIFEFIKTSPLFYQYKFIFNDIYYTEFKHTFESNLEILLKHVNTIEELALLLDKILYLKPNSLLYDNTGIIKTLFTLLIKCHYISLSVKGDQISHTEILRLVIADMIELQRYVLMNCLQIYLNDKNSQLFSLWIAIDVTAEGAKKIIDDLLHIGNKTMQLDGLKIDFCHVNQLLIVVDTSRDKEFFQEVVQMRVRLAENNYTSIEYLVKQIQINYDIHVLFWCHETILIAIMKLIVSKILYLVKKLIDIGQFRNIIQQIYKKIDRTYTPVYIKEGTEILRKVKALGTSKDIQEEMANFLDSISSVGIKSSFIKVELVQKDSQVSDDQMQQSIKTLLDFVFTNMESLKCSRYFFRPVQDDYSKYFKPLVDNKQFLFPENITKQVAHESHDCNFIKNIFFLGYHIFFFLNMNFRDAENNIIFSDLQKIFFYIKNYFLFIVRKGTDDVDMFTIAYNMYIILVNYTPDLKANWFFFRTKRIVYIIMNEMNSYGIKHCTSNNSYFLLINNINFYELGNVDYIYESIDYYFKIKFAISQYEYLNFAASINDKNYQYLSLHYFYGNFINESSVCSKYENKIKIMWHGSVKSIKEVFCNESEFVVSPLIFFALYDVYFKYSAAVIFFRIKEILLKNKLENIKSSLVIINQQLSIRHENWQRLFPGQMKDILNDINNFLLFNYSTRETLNKNKSIIENKFKNLNIWFEDINKFYSSQCTWCPPSLNSIDEKQLMSDKEFGSILDDLIRNLKTIFNYYLKIINDRPNKADQI